MVYELLTTTGLCLGMFPTEAEAVQRASYLPKGSNPNDWDYEIREWERDNEVLFHDPSQHQHFPLFNDEIH